MKKELSESLYEKIVECVGKFELIGYYEDRNHRRVYSRVRIILITQDGDFGFRLNSDNRITNVSVVKNEICRLGNECLKDSDVVDEIVAKVSAKINER